MARYKIKGTSETKHALASTDEFGYIPDDFYDKDWFWADDRNQYDSIFRVHGENGIIELDAWGSYHEFYIKDLVPYYPEYVAPQWIEELFEPNWSEPRVRTFDFTEDNLLNALRVRYGMLERPQEGLANVVVDSYFPKILYSSKLDVHEISRIGENLPKTATAISPFVAKTLGVRQMSAEQMCRFLGYPPRKLKKLLQAVQKKDLTPIFLGYGGTGVNTMHWLTEMLDMCHISGLFRSVIVYEEERLEFSNLLRFPKNILEYRTNVNRKLNLITPKEKRLMARFGVQLMHSYLRYPLHNEYSFDSKASRIAWKTKPHTFFYYGAPDIITRQRIQEFGKIPLVTATHSDLSCDIFLNPVMDSDLQVESYGVIQLAPFFMNQLRMAIGLLELLAGDENLNQVDKHYMHYQFAGEKQGTTDRIYNFQIQQNALVQTTENAAGEF